MDWEQRYQKNDTPWDKQTAHPFLSKALEILTVFRKIISHDKPNWFYPGCGTGSDIPLLAETQQQLYANLTKPSLFALDLAPSAIEQARQHSANLPNVHLSVGNALKTSFPSKHMSLVWEHTCLCALEPKQRRAYFQEISRLLPVGGHYGGFFFTHMEQDQPGPPWNLTLQELYDYLPNFILVYKLHPIHPTFPSRTNEESFLVFEKII